MVDDTRYWVRQAYVGAAVSVLCLAGVLGYLVATWDRPRRPELVVLLVGGSAVTAVALLAPLGRVVRSPSRELFFLGWSVTDVGLITAAYALDGGGTSPIGALLVLPVMFAGLGYRPASAGVLGAVTVAGYGAAVAGGRGDAADAGAVAVVLGCAGVMAVLAARNRERQRRLVERVSRRLADEATHDPLTGCLNRRAFDRMFAAELQRAERYHRPLGLLLVDVDRLKTVNDSWGHPAGDAVLRRVAGLLRAHSRRPDAVGRWGGDEFAVLAPEADQETVAHLADRLRAAVADDADWPRVAVSVGGVTRRDGDSAAALVVRADQALYADKRAAV